MHIGKWLLVKHEGKIVKGIVKDFFQDDLNIQLEDGTIIRRKFWEVRSCPFDNFKEKA
jgi:hypothetical protein